MTHTPGPWKADGNYVYGADWSGCPTLLARCPDLPGMPYNENAQIMAAAPEMFNVCLAIIDKEIVHEGEGYACAVCGEDGYRRDLIQHADGCPVGMAWAAAVKAKGAE